MKRRILIIGLLFATMGLFAQIKVACVGNSITFGGGDSTSYPLQLGKMLGKDWIVKNFGVNGATMLKKGDYPYWERPEYKQAIKFMPDVVIIKLGTNDSKPQNWDKYKEEYKKDYLDMIKTFQNLNSHPKIWLGIPAPVVADEWGIRKDIVQKDITEIVKQTAKNYNLGLIDFYNCFDGKYDLLPDHIHPNAKGYKLMAEIAVKVLNDNKDKILKRK
jgi:acyl-CoA thioesterase I